MTILVIGATGNVGRPTVDALLARGESVCCLSRSAEKIASLPRGAYGVVGDLEDGSGLADALSGVDRVFLITSNGESETERGIRAVQAVKTAGVKRIVYLSVQRPDREPAIPSFRTKLPIEAAIRESFSEFSILRPNMFNQTDNSVAKVIMDYGIYPMPIGSIGENRIDTRDIADAAVQTLLKEVHFGREYELHGPETFGGEQVAAVYAKHFRRSVNYGGDDIEKWADSVKQFISPWLLDSLKMMFADYQRNGAVADATEIGNTEAVVGHELRTFDAFATELASKMTST